LLSNAINPYNTSVNREKQKEQIMQNNDLHKKESIEFLIKNTDMFLDADYEKLASQIEGIATF